MRDEEIYDSGGIVLTANDEVHIVPVRKKESLDHINNVRQHAPLDGLNWLVGSTRDEVSVEDLGLLDPSRPHLFFSDDLIRVTRIQKRVSRRFILAEKRIVIGKCTLHLSRIERLLVHLKDFFFTSLLLGY